MKAATKTKTALVTVLFLVSFFLLSFDNSLAAQPKNKPRVSAIERLSPNLAVGIKSDNDGLRNSSIYLAGYYEIESLAQNLVEQLKVEKNAKTRILIALALYRIGNEESLEEANKVMSLDQDTEVRRMGMAIKNQLLMDSKSNMVAKGK